MIPFDLPHKTTFVFIEMQFTFLISLKTMTNNYDSGLGVQFTDAEIGNRFTDAEISVKMMDNFQQGPI